MPLIPNVLEQTLKARIRAEIESYIPQYKTLLKSKLYKVKATSLDTMGVTSVSVQQEAVNQAISKFESEAHSDSLNDMLITLLVEKIPAIVASAVTDYIKSATIIVAPGQLVTTAGTPAAQSGATTTPSSPATIS